MRIQNLCAAKASEFTESIGAVDNWISWRLRVSQHKIAVYNQTHTHISEMYSRGNLSVITDSKHTLGSNSIILVRLAVDLFWTQCTTRWTQIYNKSSRWS